RKEFKDSYAVPDVIATHPDLIDVSWHNDAAPSFAPRGLEDHENDVLIRLMVNHPDPQQRDPDVADSARFVAFSDDDVWEGDDPTAAIAALLQFYATWRAAHPLKKTRAAERRRLAKRDAERAAQDAQHREHAAA